MFLQKKRHFVHISPCVAKNEPAEEADQLWQSADTPCIIRHEKIRLLVLVASLLALLLGFVYFLLTHTSTLLFVSIVLVSLVYWSLDTYLCASERHLSS